MSFDAISDDGSTAVIGVYPESDARSPWFSRSFVPWIVDLNTKSTINLDLPTRIARHPDFN
jgi:hypothetical protein